VDLPNTPVKSIVFPKRGCGASSNPLTGQTNRSKILARRNETKLPDMTKPYGWPGDCRQVTCWEVWKQGLEPQTTMSILTTAVTASFNDVTAAAMGQQCLFDRAAQLRALIAASTRLLSHFLSGFWIIAFHQPGNNTFSDLFSNYYYSSRVINCKAAGYCFATITALIFCGFIFHIGERLFFAASIEWRRKKTCKKFSDKSNVCSRPGLAVFKMF